MRHSLVSYENLSSTRWIVHFIKLPAVYCTDRTLIEMTMPVNPSYGLEQARIQLPSIVADAHAGIASVITRHGKPYAAVVPLRDLEKSRALPSGLLALRGTGRGLWGADSRQTIGELRDEWGDDLGNL